MDPPVAPHPVPHPGPVPPFYDADMDPPVAPHPVPHPGPVPPFYDADMDPPVAPHPVPHPGPVPPFYDAAQTSVLELICKGDYGALLRSLTPSPKLNRPRVQKKSLREKREEYARRMDLWR